MPSDWVAVIDSVYTDGRSFCDDTRGFLQSPYLQVGGAHGVATASTQQVSLKRLGPLIMHQLKLVVISSLIPHPIIPSDRWSGLRVLVNVQVRRSKQWAESIMSR